MSLYNQQKFFKITSTSMYPTLKVGDVVVLGKKAPKEIKVGERDGDILILKGPQYFYNNGVDKFLLNNLPNNIPIIHRAIDKKIINNTWYFKTKGDNCWLPDGSLIIKEKTKEYIIAEYNFVKTIYIPESEVLGIVLKIIPSTNNKPESSGLSNSMLDINLVERMEVKAYFKNNKG